MMILLMKAPYGNGTVSPSNAFHSYIGGLMPLIVHFSEDAWSVQQTFRGVDALQLRGPEDFVQIVGGVLGRRVSWPSAANA